MQSWSVTSMHCGQHIKYSPTQRKKMEMESKQRKMRNTEEEKDKKSWHESKIFRKNVSVCSCLLNAGIGSIPPGSVSKAPWLMRILQSLNLLSNIVLDGGWDVQGKALLILTHICRPWGHERPCRNVGPNQTSCTGPRVNTEHSVMKIDLNWDLWHVNGRHRGILLLNGDLNMAFIKELSIM